MRRAALLLVVVAAAGCGSGSKPAAVGAGDPQRGKQVIEYIGCGACHTIPGIPGATGSVGPTLAGYKAQPKVLGLFANTPANLARWVRQPQRFLPGGVMPNLGLTRAQSEDVAAYIDR